MQAEAIPQLLTSGSIADELGVSVCRVQHILKTSGDIRPRARAGRVRLFDRRAMARIRYELNAIDARRTRCTEGRRDA